MSTVLLSNIYYLQKMGCVSSKADINDTHPTIFEVMNVDEMGHLVSPGQLELTETDLILYQRGKSATQWPLRCLRKYGFDSEIFSFECGRRCPTGPGIYAFRCRRAEQLFNMLQQNIQSRNVNEENNSSLAMYMNVINRGDINNANANNEFPVPVASTGPHVHRRIPSQTQPEGYLNPTPAPVPVRPHPSLSRPGSLTSNGPISPVTPPILSPAPDVLEHNNNKQSNLVPLPEHSYTNTGALAEADNAALPSYINVSNVAVSSASTAGIVGETYANLVAESSCHLYMNVDTESSRLNSIPISNISNTKDMPNILSNMTDIQDSLDAKPKHMLDVEETKHCYANIDAADLESLRATFNPNIELPLQTSSIPETPTYVTVREVNYAELDLVPSKSEHSSLQVTPDSPNKPNKSYVTIDFKKTNALSQSVNPSMDIEEGSRKTRHNSTISDITTRHSNSLSD